eukprot:2417339-Pleurochrysis_carterae.AAC.1
MSAIQSCAHGSALAARRFSTFACENLSPRAQILPFRHKSSQAQIPLHPLHRRALPLILSWLPTLSFTCTMFVCPCACAPASALSHAFYISQHFVLFVLAFSVAHTCCARTQSAHNHAYSSRERERAIERESERERERARDRERPQERARARARERAREPERARARGKRARAGPKRARAQRTLFSKPFPQAALNLHSSLPLKAGSSGRAQRPLFFASLLSVPSMLSPCRSHDSSDALCRAFNHSLIDIRERLCSPF